MPIYQSNKTYRGGFYNNRVINGNNDRVYNAEDIRKPYDVIFSDGVMPEADGTAGETLKVKSVGGMVISVNAGNAKLGGAWFENTAVYNIHAVQQGCNRESGRLPTFYNIRIRPSAMQDGTFSQ